MRLSRLSFCLSFCAPLAAAGVLLLQGCGGSSAHESGLEWKGEPLRVATRIDKPPADILLAGGLEALGDRPPKRILGIAPGEWGDSLRLLEFGGELEAYAAFQDLSSNPDDIAAGVTAHAHLVCFRRGRWIGVVDAREWKGTGWLENALSLPGAAGPGAIPAAFGSLLHRDRIPGSERILTGEFLGLRVTVPVFAVQADCRGDTAWVYAAPELTLSFAEAMARLPGWRVDTVGAVLRFVLDLSETSPVILNVSRRGTVGVEGCFDDNLTEYWLKMQGRGLKNLK